MSQFLSYTLPGIPYGCAYALMAAGLVLTYKASGVFNLAFGAQAYVSAIVFYVAVADGWPKWAAFIVAVVLLAPAIGYTLDRLLFQYARTAPALVRLVPALGLLIAIPSICQIIFGTSQRLSPPALALNPDHVYFWLGAVPVTGVELLTTGVTVVVVAGLALMFSSSGLGLRMRAVVESPRMTELTGIRADRVGTFAWMLSSLLAGLAGVLLAPIYAALDPSYFTALLVAAIAAAAVGGFASLSLTLVGGVTLGVVQEVIGGYLPSGTVLSSGLRPAFPFVVLAVLLVARRSFRPSGPLGDPLAVCDPPPASLKPPDHMTEVALGSRAFTGLLVAVFIIITLVLVPGNWEFAITQGLVFAIIFLSITLLTGMSGQISLCQASFAAVGAFTAGQLATHFGTALLLGVVAGGVLAGLVGMVVAIPSLRLGGIALGAADAVVRAPRRQRALPVLVVRQRRHGAQRPASDHRRVQLRGERFVLLARARRGDGRRRRRVASAARLRRWGTRRAAGLGDRRGLDRHQRAAAARHRLHALGGTCRDRWRPLRLPRARRCRLRISTTSSRSSSSSSWRPWGSTRWRGRSRRASPIRCSSS